MRRALLFCALAACSDGGRAASGDAAVAPDAAAVAPDAAAKPAGCACDPVEDCAACFAQIGRCCYDDETIGGQVGRLVATCESRAACTVCCTECAAKSCEQMRADGDCPTVEPP
jgi:hypothetical protein